MITLGILYWVFTAKYLNIDNNPAVVPIGIMAGEIDETIQHVLTWTVFMALLVKTMIASGHLFLAPFKLWQLFYGKPQKHQTKHKDKTVSITDLYNN
ncbi:MAG: hypothetical protein LBH00_09450 [Planctomycetaceae bacterium]|nr:hypothetical protein [Planctomycetaceae bacterium]